MGQNASGQTGLFPSNYVELVEDGDGPTAASPGFESAPAAGPPRGAKATPTATALYDYEAAGMQCESYPGNPGILTNEQMTMNSASPKGLRSLTW